MAFGVMFVDVFFLFFLPEFVCCWGDCHFGPLREHVVFVLGF